MLLLVELVFDMFVISMEEQSFEKPYVTLPNSANWAYKLLNKTLPLACR